MRLCANCQSEVNGHFCSNCGQAIKSRRGPIWQVASEFFLDDVFKLDSKVVTSLFTLLFKPGLLSKQFLEGKRVSVLPPVRLYLVASLLFFFVFQIPAPDVSKINVHIGHVVLGKDVPDKEMGSFNLVRFDSDKKLNFFEKWLSANLKEKEDQLRKTNPQLTINELFSRLESILPNILILFLPIFALVLKSLYFRKRILYFDHLIFLMHFQTWLMFAVVVIYSLAQQNAWWASLSLLVPIYLAKAQKVVYGQTYWLIIPKTFLIIFIYIVLTFAASLLAFLTSIALL